MITEFNRFLIYIGSEIEKAKKECERLKLPNIIDEDPEYALGYLHALEDVKEKAIKIYHGEE